MKVDSNWWQVWSRFKFKRKWMDWIKVDVKREMEKERERKVMEIDFNGNEKNERNYLFAVNKPADVNRRPTLGESAADFLSAVFLGFVVVDVVNQRHLLLNYVCTATISFNALIYFHAAISNRNGYAFDYFPIILFCSAIVWVLLIFSLTRLMGFWQQRSFFIEIQFASGIIDTTRYWISNSIWSWYSEFGSPMTLATTTVQLCLYSRFWFRES